MHDHVMDTSEAPPKGVPREGINGAHVITTALESSPSASISNQKAMISVTAVGFQQEEPPPPLPAATTQQQQILHGFSLPSQQRTQPPPPPPPSSSSSSVPVSSSTLSSTQSQPQTQAQTQQIAVPSTTFQTPAPSPVHQKPPTLILTPNCIPSGTHSIPISIAPPHHTVVSTPPVAAQTRVSIQGSPYHPHQLSVITSSMGASVIQTFAAAAPPTRAPPPPIPPPPPPPPPPSSCASEDGVVEGESDERCRRLQQQGGRVGPVQEGTSPVVPSLGPRGNCNMATITPVPVRQSRTEADVPKKEDPRTIREEEEEEEGIEVSQDDSSDTDMEIKSLDLTSCVNINDGDKKERERERPMSWECDLSDSEIEKYSQEEQMRVEATEEPMSPMSPVSRCSDNDQESLPTQIKSEEDVLDAHNKTSSAMTTTAFTAQTLPQTDSPVPARSDSGCELHLGPFTPTQSPLLPRIHPHAHSPTHLYSPTQSPSQSRHLSGFSSPYSHSPSTGLSRNNSDASQYGGSYNSYSSAPSPISPIHYSPSQSPNLGRVIGSFHSNSGNHGTLFGGPVDLREPHSQVNSQQEGSSKEVKEDERLSSAADLAQHSVLAAQSGITRQQLINSPCPICGDKISGFHYGIFSCESCKGFFKRTVQNKKHYVCMRGSSCPVTIATRKKCPACRFDKCLRKGMKLEAIREDRTRGGRSTYQCAPYTLPPSLVSPSSSGVSLDQGRVSDGGSVKSEPQEGEDVNKPSSSREKPTVPPLLQQICDVEHLWHCSEAEMSQIRQADAMAREMMESDSADCVSMCKIAEGRLYKIVKWCKSLPLFRHISIDDQIILLMNSWCELLLLSCCFRSMDSPGEIRVSSGRTMSLSQAEAMGIGPCIERMLNLSYQLRRLQVDSYEYMAMKVIVLLTSDVAGLKEGEKVRHSQEKVVQALQEYTLAKYPHLPSKFGELLLRIPELQRTCHASKEMLSVKKKEGDVPSFNFLFELLRGDH